MSVDHLIETMQIRLHADWAVCEFDIDVFPALATAVLSDFIGEDALNMDSFLAWLADGRPLPNQARLDQTFGQPPLTLAWNGLFQIDVLFWSAAGTAIHGHGFAGAFGVLEGDSLHFEFNFDEQQRLSDGFRLGKIRRTSLERLSVGAVRPIVSGSMVMHALVHLGRPSISMVIRTCGTRDGVREFVAFPPAVCASPLPVVPIRTRQIQLLEMLIRIDSPDAASYLSRLMANCDVQTAFDAMCTAVGKGGTMPPAPGRLTTIWPMMTEAGIQEQRRKRVDVMFRQIGARQARALLAILLFADDAAGIIADVVATFPEEDVATFMGTAIATLANLDMTIEEDQAIAEALAVSVLGAANGALPLLLDPALSKLRDALASDLLFAPMFRTPNNMIHQGEPK
jgi:hypothetical protein